jgi:hypothetical protein
MPLIKCKVCENMISTNAEFCPHCGEKYLITSKVVIHRKAAFTGSAVGLDIIIDGVLIKRLRNDESITLELSPGNHTVTASGAWGSDSMQINIIPLKAYNIDVRHKFSGVVFESNMSEV